MAENLDISRACCFAIRNLYNILLLWYTFVSHVYNKLTQAFSRWYNGYILETSYGSTPVMVAHQEQYQGLKQPLLEKIGNPILVRLFGIGHHTTTVEGADKATGLFLERAKEYVKIIEGELIDANPETEQALRHLCERGMKIEIITGPDISEHNKKLLLELGLDLYQLRERPPIHFSILDGKHLKVEEYHVPDQQKRRFYIKYHADLTSIDYLVALFETLKSKAVPVV